MADDKTTGLDQSPDLVAYAKLNLQRMARWEKTLAFLPELVAQMALLKGEYGWLVLTEGWCGDAAQSLPVIAQIAALSPHVHIGLLLRDEHLPLMDKYLTNGGRAIPKLIVFDRKTGEELATWGPRPKEAQELVLRLKHEGVEKEDLYQQVHTWYAKNKAVAIQEEFLAMAKMLCEREKAHAE
jgi:hypothetical protein